MYDYLIKNVSIIDGTGKAPYSGVVAIEGQRIAQIVSTSEGIDAENVIDGHSKVLAPGFIDVSNHADTHGSLFQEPDMIAVLAQGVTTLIGGNCGTSVAPLLSAEAIKALSKWGDGARLNRNWSSMHDFLESLSKMGASVNFGTLVGYSTVHRSILIEERPFTQEEIEQSLLVASKALDQGALGVSLGLMYSRMNLVSDKELRQLAELIAQKKKLLVVHIRHDGEEILGAIDECLDLARQTGVRLHLSHIKLMGKKNWSLFPQLLERLQSAIANPDVSVSYDVFPYTASNPFLYVMLPHWITKHGRQEMLIQLREDSIRDLVIQEMKANGYDYNRIIVSSAESLPTVVGSNILQIAKNQGVGIEEALVYLVRATHGQARVIVQAIDQDNLDALVLEKGGMVGSDGIGYGQKTLDSHGFDHPRSFGTFPQFLVDYAKSGKMSWEEAITRITRVPAERYGLHDRGIIQEGAYADLVLFDPQKINAPSHYTHPSQLSEGVDSVWVSGRLAWTEGMPTGEPFGGSVIKVT